MWGEPQNVDGQCNARLYIGDIYGDNHATMRCQLEPEHNGPHQEIFQRSGKPVTITWYVDEREEYALNCEGCRGRGCWNCMPEDDEEI